MQKQDAAAHGGSALGRQGILAAQAVRSEIGIEGPAHMEARSNRLVGRAANPGLFVLRIGDTATGQAPQAQREIASLAGASPHAPAAVYWCPSPYQGTIR